MLGFDQSKLVYHYFNMQYIKFEIQGGTYRFQIFWGYWRYPATNAHWAKIRGHMDIFIFMAK